MKSFFGKCCNEKLAQMPSKIFSHLKFKKSLSIFSKFLCVSTTSKSFIDASNAVTKYPFDKKNFVSQPAPQPASKIDPCFGRLFKNF